MPAVESSEAPQSQRGPQSRGFWRGQPTRLLAIYLALLGLSHAAQAFALVPAREVPPGALLLKSDPPPTDLPRRATQLPVQRANLPTPADASAEEIRLAYLDFPARNVGPNGTPPIIVLHGSPGRARDQAHIAGRLAARHRVIVPDLPGFGDSERYIPDYSIRAHARYVLALMDRLEIAETLLFAHSMGGGVSFELVRLAPERIRGIVLYSAIGIQSGEGSGDYHIEHAKYALGYGALVILPEVLPHFGLLGTRSFRHSFIRNFYDSDQRPLRAAIERLGVPLLILQGVHDPLVPALTAEEHHRLVAHSELRILDASHFLVFTEAGAGRLAGPTLDFFERYAPAFRAPDWTDNAGDAQKIEARERYAFAARPAAGDLPARGPGVAVRESNAHRAEVDLPVSLNPGGIGTNAWAKLGAIIAGTFVSEDLTCISAGLLIRANRLDLFTGLLGCFIGIFAGDLGLYLMGRLVGLGLLRSRRVAQLLPPAALDRLAARFDREGWKLIFLSRFVPGTRFPVYTGAGLIGGRAGRLILIALLAGMIWTPALVFLTIYAGPKVLAPIEAIAGEGWLALLIGILAIFFALRFLFTTLIALATRDGRRDLWNGLRRWGRAEFWPAWLFYAPLVPICAWFTLKYRGFGTITASNPGIRHGGLIGESKAEILDCLRPGAAEYVLDYLLVPAHGPAQSRAEQVLAHMRARADETGWQFPIILKPDVAQRGSGLKLARTAEQVHAYFAEVSAAVIAQVYHPGPYEAGVFYYRMPGAERGEIFSITDKVFPEVVGDGRSTLRELIYAHPRYSLQSRMFLERHAKQADDVPAAGTPVRLAIAGNHSQGTLFREGGHLSSEALRELTDRISQGFEGFYFGRYDIRYSDPEALQRGEEFAIIELNGATSESTNLYDPEKSVRSVYGILYRQWELLFRIGATNRRRGHPALSLAGVLGELWRYRRVRTTIPGD